MFVRGGVNEDEMLPVAEETEQMESARAAVHQICFGCQAMFFQVSNGDDAHAFVAHEQVADAENQGLHKGWRTALCGNPKLVK